MTVSARDNQRSFSPLDDAGKRKTTKREVFQAVMAAVVPWTALEAVIDPHDPKMGTGDQWKFVAPAEVDTHLSLLGFDYAQTRGIERNPLTMRWRVTHSAETT